MGQYKNGKWEPTFGDVQAGVSDWAPGEGPRAKDDHIEALEAKVTSLQLIEKHLLQCCKDHKSRIKELKARLKQVEETEKDEPTSPMPWNGGSHT